MTWSSGWQRNLASPAWAVAVAVILAACSGDATNPESEVSAGRFGNPPSYIKVTPKDNVVPVAGAKVQLSVEVRDSRGKTIKNARVDWRSLAPEVADVNAGGTVTTYAQGTARIVVEASPVSDTAWVVVQAGPVVTAQVKLSPASAIIPDVGGTTQLSAQVLDAAGNEIANAVPVWSSADVTIATVSSSGKVVGLKQGDTEIRASHGGKTGTSTVSVAPPPPPVSLTVTPASDSITAIGGTKQYVAKLEDASGAAVAAQAVTWSSMDASIADVDGSGKATGKAKGHTRLIASYQSLADTADVHVVPPPTASRIAISPKADTIPTVGGTVTLAATVYDENDAPIAGASVVWASLDPTAAIVGPGMVAGVSKGVARITAKSGSLADTAQVWVAPAPGGATVQFRIVPDVMVVEQLNTIWEYGASLDSAGTTRSVKPTSPGQSSDPLTVHAEGYIWAKSLKNGQAMLIATYNGMRDSALVKVGNVTTSSVSIPADSDTITAVGDTAKVKAVVVDDGGNIVIGPAVTWSSLDPSIATVSGTTDVATVTAVAGGSARIVAQRGTFKDTITVKVMAPPPPAPGSVVQVNPAADTIPSVGGSRQLSVSVVDAQGNPSANQSVTWTSLNPGVAAVSAGGMVTGMGPGVALISATQGSSADTASIWVAPSSGGGGPPQSGQTVDLNLVRWTSGSGSVRVSSGIPLPSGALQPSQLRNLVIYVNGVEQSLYVEALQGRHADGSLRSVLVQFNYSVPSSGTSAQLVLGPNVNRTTTDIAKTNPGVTYGQPLQAAVALPASPAYLTSTGIVGETKAAASTFSTRWESQFTQYDDPKWNLLLSQYGTSTLDVNRVTTVNYYDRALIYYAWWVRTGNPEYWKRAAYAYLPWRDTYMKPNAYRVQPNNIHIEGMEAHYLLTGDQESLTGVKLAAEYLYDVWLAKMGDLTNPWIEGRIQARTLDGLLTAARLQVTSRNFQNATQQALSAILSTQQADGSYRFISICNTHYNYMTGLLHEVYIKYYQDFSADARIPVAMKKALDFMWNTQWLPSSGGFQYASGYCPGLAGPSPAPDLNLLIANGYGWYARHSGDGSYRTKGDVVFHEGVMRAWLVGEKQFNESYRSSFHYEAYRQ
jgi:hypothetical protein